jgi:hypothetical protein
MAHRPPDSVTGAGVERQWEGDRELDAAGADDGRGRIEMKRRMYLRWFVQALDWSVMGGAAIES